jgi:hypothetical protein
MAQAGKGNAVKLGRPTPYTICLIGGMAIGFIVGGWLFPELEEAFGAVATDILLGVGGALLGGLGYEVAANFSRRE